MNIVEKLYDIGFTEYEAKVYASLVAGNALTASEICQLAGVPQGRVYGVLATLMEMGMCVMIPEKIKKYQALPPRDTFASLYEQRRKKYEAEETKAIELSEQLSEIYDEEGNTDYDIKSVFIYTSMANTVKKSEQMISGAKEIHRSLCKPPSRMPPRS